MAGRLRTFLQRIVGRSDVSPASAKEELTIQASKPPGPVEGEFTASGAIADSGKISNVDFVYSAHGAPDFGITHIKILFEGRDGTFTVATQIRETLTVDPNVMTDEGTWTIIAGTGAYADLHGTGTVVGQLDDNVNLITRTFQGEVHFH